MNNDVNELISKEIEFFIQELKELDINGLDQNEANQLATILIDFKEDLSNLKSLSELGVRFHEVMQNNMVQSLMTSMKHDMELHNKLKHEVVNKDNPKNIHDKFTPD